MTEIKKFDAERKGLLDGVRVVDLSRLVAGNMATHVLADYGADVIKVERPGKGDDLRNWRVKGIEVFWKAFLGSRSGYRIGIPSVPLAERSLAVHRGQTRFPEPP